MSAQYVEEWLAGPHATKFYTRTYNVTNPAASIVFIHGAAEHSGRFTELHSKFAQQRISVFTLDLRGYGKTALEDSHKSPDSAYGKTDWDRQLDDLEWAITTAHEKFKPLPLFLMGTSMGGGLVLGLKCDTVRQSHAAVKLVSGVIASSPCITLTLPPPGFAISILGTIGSLWPTLIYPVRNKLERLSRNPETNTAYTLDSLVRTPGTLKGLYDMIHSGQQILSKGYANWPPKLPVLFLHGTADEVTSCVSAQKLFEKLPADDKTMITYPGGLHELHNEPDGIKEKSLADVAAFIFAHIGLS